MATCLSLALSMNNIYQKVSKSLMRYYIINTYVIDLDIGNYDESWCTDEKYPGQSIDEQLCLLTEFIMMFFTTYTVID